MDDRIPGRIWSLEETYADHWPLKSMRRFVDETTLKKMPNTKVYAAATARAVATNSVATCFRFDGVSSAVVFGSRSRFCWLESATDWRRRRAVTLSGL